MRATLRLSAAEALSQAVRAKEIMYAVPVNPLKSVNVQLSSKHNNDDLELLAEQRRDGNITALEYNLRLGEMNR